MALVTHAQDSYGYTQDGALVVSEERIQEFVAEWRDELAWLADH